METNGNPWTKFYESALLQSDEKKMIESVKLAEAAIGRRLHDIAEENDKNHHAERHTIDDAIRTLRYLRSEAT